MKHTAWELFQLSPDVRALSIALEDPDLAEADQEKVINDLLDKRNDFESCIQELALYSQELKRKADAQTAEAQRLADMAARTKNSMESLKRKIMSAMTFANLTRVRGDLCTISIAGNGGLEPLRIDEGALPKDCIRLIAQPDTAIIRDKLKAGEKIPGVVVEPRGTHLRIS